MSKRIRPELLAPAGNIEAFISAVENGADAVYMGGTLFNARMNANNFDEETMQQAIDYAHKRGVVVHVTVNTLLRDDELEEALAYARKLYQMGVDVLIVQDLGLASLIHREMPDFPLHFSTQGTATDIETVRAATELGFERVVLSRELSLEEIKEICDAKVTDIEVFVHGALCICYSGQCQMSRYYGGRSGNRGQCAQPCRLPYKTSNGTTHILSPKDLCQIDNLGELMDAGVISFKIEGRMKHPEYVGTVVRIYRKYIDEYLENGTYTVTAEDRRALLQIFNRGGFTEGYLHGDPGDALMSPRIPKNQGIYMGQVTSVKKGSSLIDARLDRRTEGSEVLTGGELHIGDGVEIRGEGRTASNIVTYIKPNSDGTVRIGDFRTEIRKGDRVYRTSSKEQIDEIAKSYRGFDIADKSENWRVGRKRPIEMMLRAIHTGEYDEYGNELGQLALSASSLRSDGEQWDSQERRQVTVESGPFEVDFERPTPKERYESALRKTGSTPFEVTRIRFAGDFDLKVRAAEINALRRVTLERLEQEFIFRRELPETVHELEVTNALTSSATEASASKEGDAQFEQTVRKTEYYFHTLEAWENATEEMRESIRRDGIVLLPLAQICQRAEETEQSIEEAIEATASDNVVIPYITNVTLGLEEKILEAHWAEVIPWAKATGCCIYAGSLGWLCRLTKAGVQALPDYGINIFNRVAIAAVANLGNGNAAGGSMSLEAIEQDAGALPLMVTRHAFNEDVIENTKRGIRAEIFRRPYSDQMLILPIDSKVDPTAKRIYVR